MDKEYKRIQERIGYWSKRQLIEPSKHNLYFYLKWKEKEKEYLGENQLTLFKTIN